MPNGVESGLDVERDQCGVAISIEREFDVVFKLEKIVGRTPFLSKARFVFGKELVLFGMLVQPALDDSLHHFANAGQQTKGSVG